MPKLSYDDLADLAARLRDLQAGVDHLDATISDLYPDNYREAPTREQLLRAVSGIDAYLAPLRAAALALPKEGSR